MIVLVVAMLGVPSAELPQSLTSPTCVACRENAASVAATASVRRQLEDGDIVVSHTEEAEASGSTRRVVEVTGVINHRPAQVWNVIIDFKTRKAWEPGCQEIAVTRVDGNRIWVEEHMRFFLVGVRYRIINTLDPEAGMIRFSLDESAAHDIAGTTGSWRLIPRANGRQTLVTYRAWIDIGYLLPEALQSFLMKRSLPSLLENLRTEVDRRFQDPE